MILHETRCMKVNSTTTAIIRSLGINNIILFVDPLSATFTVF
jgi:hypothetical protein